MIIDPEVSPCSASAQLALFVFATQRSPLQSNGYSNQENHIRSPGLIHHNLKINPQVDHSFDGK
jgi:hypothetical protein